LNRLVEKEKMTKYSCKITCELLAVLLGLGVFWGCGNSEKKSAVKASTAVVPQPDISTMSNQQLLSRLHLAPQETDAIVKELMKPDRKVSLEDLYKAVAQEVAVEEARIANLKKSEQSPEAKKDPKVLARIRADEAEAQKHLATLNAQLDALEKALIAAQSSTDTTATAKDDKKGTPQPTTKPTAKKSPLQAIQDEVEGNGAAGDAQDNNTGASAATQPAAPPVQQPPPAQQPQSPAPAPQPETPKKSSKPGAATAIPLINLKIDPLGGSKSQNTTSSSSSSTDNAPAATQPAAAPTTQPSSATPQTSENTAEFTNGDVPSREEILGYFNSPDTHGTLAEFLNGIHLLRDSIE